MKNLIIIKLYIGITILFFSCALLKSTGQRKSNYYYNIGNFNGEFESIKIYQDIDKVPIYYEYKYDRKSHIMSRLTNHIPDLYIYYDENNTLDSVIDLSYKPVRTTYYYKTPYREFYARHSSEGGLEMDFISEKIDFSKDIVSFVNAGRISSIDSFDSEKKLVKKTLLDAQTFETYNYDLNGNIKKQYINMKINNKDSLFNILSFDYELDKFNNWTLKTQTKNYLNGKQLVIKTKRIVEY